MTEDAEARRIAGEALSRIRSHENYCEERARRAELFEAQTTTALSNIQERMDKSVSRIHDKLENCVSDIGNKISQQREESARSRAVQTIILSIATPAVVGIIMLWAKG